jgi:hypothetical protein
MKHRYMESENVIFGYDVVADEQRVQIDVPILDAQLAIRFAQFRPRVHDARTSGFGDVARHTTAWRLRVKLRAIRLDRKRRPYLFTAWPAQVAPIPRQRNCGRCKKSRTH